MNHMKTDVLVCGGGCAGLVAALASARMGAKTLLIERAGFAGGIVTAMGLPFFDGIAHQGSTRIVVRGIALELAVQMGIVLAECDGVKVRETLATQGAGPFTESIGG